MNKLRIGLKALVAVSVILAIMVVAPSIGRYTPTHLIVQDVYCGSCHPEEIKELGDSGAHLAHFSSGINSSYTKISGGTPLPAALALSGGCTMCHNYWDNMEWFGVTNFTLTQVENVTPVPVTDIYGNTISPYGLSSTTGFDFGIGGTTGGNAGKYGNGVEPWQGGLGVYQYTNATNVTKTRVDYVWSALSAISPGPAFFSSSGGKLTGGCGTAEKGLCHIAQNAVAQSEAGARPEFPNVNGAELGPGNTTISSSGSGVFFRHEMAYTTAQYAAKPVKLCGACHVFKLPPMVWGGEPWSQKVIELTAQTGLVNNTLCSNGVNVGCLPPAMPNGDQGDPFGFTPLYPQTGQMSLVYAGHNQTFNVAYKTPDWAHSNVPCIRCHTHAGVNDETVSGNFITNTSTGVPGT